MSAAHKLCSTKLDNNKMQFLQLISSSSVIYIVIYIIAQVILAFWLVPAYDLLEDRRTIDVIITKFSLFRFKIAESFEN